MLLEFSIDQTFKVKKNIDRTFSQKKIDIKAIAVRINIKKFFKVGGKHNYQSFMLNMAAFKSPQF